MVRVVLTGWLILHTVVGPWLCCCTLLRSLATAASAPTFQASLAPEKHSCCHADPDAHSAAPKGESDAVSPSRHHPCPCRQNLPDVFDKALPAPATAELSSPDHWLRSGSAALFVLVAQPDVVTTSLFDSSGGNLLPFLTTQELLRTHHVLRC